MTEKLNDSLLNGVEGLSKNLYEYSLSRGFQYSEAEALASLESAKPYFKEKIKAEPQRISHEFSEAADRTRGG
jgi:hypothetical protein